MPILKVGSASFCNIWRSFCFCRLGSLASSWKSIMVRALLPAYLWRKINLRAWSPTHQELCWWRHRCDSIGSQRACWSWCLLVMRPKLRGPPAVLRILLILSFLILLLLKSFKAERDWGSCVEQFNFIGRKQAESQFRKDVEALLANLRCKNSDSDFKRDLQCKLEGWIYTVNCFLPSYLLTFLPSYLLTFKPQSPFPISLSPFLVELRQVATLAKRKTPNYNVWK